MLQPWRHWHCRINQNQRRYVVCSANWPYISLVMAKGHRVDNIGEVPLVVSDSIESLSKTKDAQLLSL